MFIKDINPTKIWRESLNNSKDPKNIFYVIFLFHICSEFQTLMFALLLSRFYLLLFFSCTFVDSLFDLKLDSLLDDLVTDEGR